MKPRLAIELTRFLMLCFFAVLAVGAPPFQRGFTHVDATVDPTVPVLRELVAWRGQHRSILSRTVSVPGSRAAAAGQTITFDVLDPNHGARVVASCCCCPLIVANNSRLTLSCSATMCVLVRLRQATSRCLCSSGTRPRRVSPSSGSTTQAPWNGSSEWWPGATKHTSTRPRCMRRAAR